MENEMETEAIKRFEEVTSSNHYKEVMLSVNINLIVSGHVVSSHIIDTST